MNASADTPADPSSTHASAEARAGSASAGAAGAARAGSASGGACGTGSALPLHEALRSQGFGTRQELRRAVRKGRVRLRHGAAGEWRMPADPDQPVSLEGLEMEVAGLSLPYRARLYLVLHKPPGVECSRAPGPHRSVFSLLPHPFLNRGLQSVGRLDADTTGLLILTDDGAFNHRLTSPRRHVPRTYRVRARHDLSGASLAALARGVGLRGEKEPTLTAHVRRLDAKNLEITLREGRYHQLKRMLGAVGNRAEAIHRIAMGQYTLPRELHPGQWRYLDEEALTALEQDAAAEGLDGLRGAPA